MSEQRPLASTAGPGHVDGRGETHVAGVLLHAQPDLLPAVCAAVEALPLAAVTHRTPDGRAVAVLEGRSARRVTEQMDAIRAIHGVLAVSLVYQHAEPDDEMDKEMTA